MLTMPKHTKKVIEMENKSIKAKKEEILEFLASLGKDYKKMQKR